MVRPALLFTALGASLGLSAQGDAPYFGAGLLRASAAIAPGFMTAAPATNIYVTGDLEYFIDDRVSIHGEGYWYLNGQQQRQRLAQNSQLACGPAYHWVFGRLDLNAQFSAGVSFAQPYAPDIPEGLDPVPLTLRVTPHLALGGGIVYHVWDYIHFFADVRYLRSRYQGADLGPIVLDELVVGAGMGFQLRLWK